MALLDSEIVRIKWHLGYNVLDFGAEPYIGIAAVFDKVIKPYVGSGTATTSSTIVAAASTPSPIALTLASGTGFADGARIVVDVDSRQERVTAQSVVGATLTVLLQQAHTGTYPVTVEGADTVIRDLLKNCNAAWDAYSNALSSAGIKQLGQGEIEWFPDSANGGGKVAVFKSMLNNWRDELASALGLPRQNRSGGHHVSSLY